MQKKLYSKIRKWIKNNKVVDVVIFGSFVRGKTKPNDIDLCIIIKDTDEKKTFDLIDSFSKITTEYNIQINTLTSSDFVKGNTLSKQLLEEGFSIKKLKPFSNTFNLVNQTLFVYTLKKFNSSKRVKFHYMLKGRYGREGILEEVEGSFLGTGSILIPTKHEDALKEVFDTWQVEYYTKRILVKDIN